MQTTSTLSKVCNRCQSEKSGDEFYSHKNGKLGLYSWCKSCCREVRNITRNPEKEKERYSKWLANNPDYHSEWHKNKWSDESYREARRWHRIKFRYNLTQTEYDALLVKQSGKCAICQTIPDKFHIDHCHDTGVVSGLLCPQCNLGLGLFKSEVNLQRAARYLGV